VKIVLFDDNCPGVLQGDVVVDLTGFIPGSSSTAGRGQRMVERLITSFDALRPYLESQLARLPRRELRSVRLRSPLPRPGKIMAMALNYNEYVSGEAYPPAGFFKSPDSVLDPEGTCELPPDAFQVCHHEAELVAVIGRRADRVTPDEALKYVFGYTCGVDVSARFGTSTGIEMVNTLLGKSYAGFSPLGPAIATPDEVGSPEELRVRLWVDGELRVDYGTEDMGNNVAQCIAYFSARTPLNPGDVIFLGTNHQGLGPMQDGERIELEIDKIGRFGFNVRDPLRRSWPKGVDRVFADSMIARRRLHTGAGVPVAGN
jgi:2-keto-4-pentenoate hydratase/2-oxohepta-3-ene-1,7-dioic acid hydratase in catechol pathway